VKGLLVFLALVALCLAALYGLAWLGAPLF